jgi:hypothetical protein
MEDSKTLRRNPVMEPNINHPTPSFRTSRDAFGHNYQAEDAAWGVARIIGIAVCGMLIAAAFFWYGALL